VKIFFNKMDNVLSNDERLIDDGTTKLPIPHPLTNKGRPRPNIFTILHNDYLQQLEIDGKVYRSVNYYIYAYMLKLFGLSNLAEKMEGLNTKVNQFQAFSIFSKTMISSKSRMSTINAFELMKSLRIAVVEFVKLEENRKWLSSTKGRKLVMTPGEDKVVLGDAIFIRRMIPALLMEIRDGDKQEEIKRKFLLDRYESNKKKLLFNIFQIVSEIADTGRGLDNFSYESLLNSYFGTRSMEENWERLANRFPEPKFERDIYAQQGMMLLTGKDFSEEKSFPLNKSDDYYINAYFYNQLQLAVQKANRRLAILQHAFRKLDAKGNPIIGTNNVGNFAIAEGTKIMKKMWSAQRTSAPFEIWISKFKVGNMLTTNNIFIRAFLTSPLITDVVNKYSTKLPPEILEIANQCKILIPFTNDIFATLKDGIKYSLPSLSETFVDESPPTNSTTEISLDYIIPDEVFLENPQQLFMVTENGTTAPRLSSNSPDQGIPLPTIRHYLMYQLSYPEWRIQLESHSPRLFARTLPPLSLFLFDSPDDPSGEKKIFSYPSARFNAVQ